MVNESQVKSRVKEVFGLLMQFFGSDLKLKTFITEPGEIMKAGAIAIDAQYMEADLQVAPHLIKNKDELDKVLLHEAIHTTQVDFFQVHEMMMELLDKDAKKIFDLMWTTAMERNVVYWEKVFVKLDLTTSDIADIMNEKNNLTDIL